MKKCVRSIELINEGVRGKWSKWIRTMGLINEGVPGTWMNSRVV